MEDKFDSFPVNICESTGPIKRTPFRHKYRQVDIWQNQECIFSEVTNGLVSGQISVIGTLEVAVDDSTLCEIIPDYMGFEEISTNINRIIWSNNLHSQERPSEDYAPFVCMLFYKNKILKKVVLRFYNPDIYVELY